MGDNLDGEGGFTARGRLVTSQESIKNNYLPLGLTDGAIMKKKITKDQYIKLDDVEINWKEEVLTARKYQNELIK